jgi:hypothetical protein
MREYDVEVCSEECGRTKLQGHEKHWLVWQTVALTAGIVVISKGSPGYCPACGTRVGIDERGHWRERMVPRSSLEWMMEFTSQCPENAEYPDDCPAETGVLGGRECVECWTRAAIKAAEEASGE